MIRIGELCITLLFFLTDYCIEVAAEICSSGQECKSPYTCCDGNCCHDNDSGYTYGYRMSFWNLWYFWFIILFVLMSCFGGCGYYKQRQRIIGGRGSGPARCGRRSRTIILTTGETNTAPYAYSGPGAEPYGNVFQPPPYSEVVLQPGMYPGNKEHLPPYPGFTNSDEVPINTNIGPPQPPPYTEVANQNADQSQSTNQNAAQPAYQNTLPPQSTYQNVTQDLQQATRTTQDTNAMTNQNLAS